ncbi:sensor histidine kinase [Acrocarpospora macrocephala]|uniref:histidine kinase n=1 Tax=Acrocarpospora macrocephala TaxID=150177 RepID=A0A5M3WVK2_9ACTN|nr:histidine kinase [Acrocarpospora macrocephala]GES12019.1 two-component sensor histidine kinase [Acrocarpospora macrocephala]
MQPTTLRVTARRLWLDATLILLLAAATLLWSDSLLMFGKPDEKLLVTFGSVDAWRTHVIWWCLAGVPAAVAIVLRHRWPLTATLMAAGSVGAHLLDPVMKSPPMDIAVLITMYTLAGSAHTRRNVIAVLVAAEAVLFAGCLKNVMDAIVPGQALSILLNATKAAAVPALLLAATWAVADSARTRRAHLATLQARADDLEREQQQRTALAVAAERSRITRELHDVVAHGLSVMVVQAQGAKAILARQPERTEAALTNIVTTGRASLAEMRRLLGLVRTEPRAELEPQPSLARLPELVDRVRDSGTPVDFRVTGEPATLPAVIELAAYRIVQEALTNTLKHATPGAGCTVALDFGPAGLDIRIADSGEPVPPPLPGNGLRGITERVHALGGDLWAGPAAGGGFEVSARLPVAVGTSPELVA